MSKSIRKNIYGYEDLFNLFEDLDKKNKLPNKFIISGKKGIGKSTFAYHLINYLLSKNEKYNYDKTNYQINEKNRSYKLVKDLSHPNFFLIDVDEGKEQITIDKVRKSFEFINRSSMNNDYRIVLIDNLEYLNVSSANALLKIIEEPNEKLIFILIHNSSHKLMETIKSRCLFFKKNFSENDNILIFEKLTNNNFTDIFDDNLLAKFMSVEELLLIRNFSIENNFSGKINTLNILKFFFKVLKNKFDKRYQFIILKLIQIFLYQKNRNFCDENNFIWYNSFFKKVSYAKKFNLDIGNLFFEFQDKNLNE